MLIKVYDWIWHRGYDHGYNAALQDVKKSMLDRTLDQLDWELELLRVA